MIISKVKNNCLKSDYYLIIINKKGKVIDADVLRSVDPLLDEEAIRVVKSSPEWNPGKLEGEDVNVRLIIPISFSLGKNFK